MKPGINHIEIWVSDIDKSSKFYKELFSIIGWKELGKSAWSSGTSEIYLREEKATSRILSLGVHHICMQATNKEMVNRVADWLRENKSKIFNGPQEMTSYSAGYFTIDFYDPDGFILEVAYTPNMKL